MKRKWRIFRQGSRTYFSSSVFFPSHIRSEVATLYAFVRVADDFVDSQPQDEEGFEEFYASYKRALVEPVGDEVVDDFVSLMRLRGFTQAWVESFFDAMRSDFDVVDYQTYDELLGYVYGSAEVVGLMMARIMQLPSEADEAARLLGRCMQLINFVRDVKEDNALGRMYLPASWRGELADLSESSARSNPEVFAACLARGIAEYRSCLSEAQEGFSFIPRRCLIPIRTASQMYSWTARRIEEDPLVVFSCKVKPSKLRVFVAGLRNAFR